MTTGIRKFSPAIKSKICYNVTISFVIAHKKVFKIAAALLVAVVVLLIAYVVFRYLSSSQPTVPQESNAMISDADHFEEKEIARKTRASVLLDALKASTFEVTDVAFTNNALVIDNMMSYKLNGVQCSLTLTTASGKEVKKASNMQAASKTTSYCNGFTIPFEEINEYGDVKAQIGVSHRNVLKIAETSYNIPKPKERKKVVFIGDSITRGYLATSSNAVQVASAIMNNDPKYAYDVTNLGNNGARATDYMYGVDIGKAAKADYVMISLGVNDALQKESAATYANAMRSIINALQRNGVGKIILNKSVCTGGSGISASLEEYGRSLYGLVGGNVVLGDFTACEMTKSDGSLINADGIHLTNTGYRRLGERWASAFSANK